jgi:subtilisin family serine protease
VTISSDVFNGASYQFDPKKIGEDPIQLLSSLPTVKNVWPVEIIARPTDEIHWAGNDPTNIPADIKKSIALNSTSYAPHTLTQVDKLHAEGLTGKGIRIGIVDDGVDYKHPALGGGFGPGFTVVRGYDHVGDNFTLSREVDPVPDPDPYANCDGHGTHVTGIIAAQANQHGFLGAAPGVEIGMYRVFSCIGDTTNDVVAAGITKAYQDGNHIITASLGKRSGWSEDPLAVLSERISQKGVILTFAQGNSGSAGPFMAESPATGKGTTAVASTDNTEIARVLLNATYSINGTSDKPFGWTYGYPDEWGNVSLPLYVGDYESAEANLTCDEFSKAGNLSNQIVLIRSVYWCSDYQKSNYAAAKGASYALFYYNDTDATEIARHPAPQPKAIGWLPASTAADFVRLDKAGQKLTLHITDPKYAKQYVEYVTDVLGGFMSSYSSWGPTFELDLKPDIAAPGGHILSTWPEALGKYAVISGTSMATPLVAGIYALLLEARGRLTGEELRSLLASTSKPLTLLSRSNSTDLSPTPQQGSGIIQAWNAVHASGIPSVSKLVLNDTDHFERYHNFTIRNTGSQEVTYSLSSQGAPSFYTLNPGSNSPARPNQLQLFRQYADIMFSAAKITVGPGEEVKVTFQVSTPGAVNATRLPIYSGFIYLGGSNGEKLSLPYIGVAGR